MHVFHPMTSVLGAACCSTHSCYQELIRNRGFMRDRKQQINYKLSSDWMRNVAQYCVKLQKDIAEKLHWLWAAGLEA